MFVSKTSSRHLQDMYSRLLQDMSSRRLQDVFARHLERRKIVTLKTCWKRLEDVLKTSWKPTNVCWDRCRSVTGRNLGIFFFKMGVTLAVLSPSGKTPCWNERFIKNVRGCFISLAWFLRILKIFFLGTYQECFLL